MEKFPQKLQRKVVVNDFFRAKKKRVICKVKDKRWEVKELYLSICTK